MKKRESGFSMVELVIVVAIILIVTAMAAPSVKQVVDNYRLHASGQGVASVLQQARMAAVQSNQPYYVQYNGCGAPNIICAVPAGRFLPLTVLPGVVGAAPQVGGVIGFNARGMPCVQTVGPWVCPPPGTGFEWFMQSGSTGAWEAITVTPAGRIRSWRMTSATSWQ